MRRIILWISLLVVIIPVILPLTKEGFFPSHDGEWAIVRLAEMHREVRDLQFPPRWSDFLNHGYGYPLFHYTYPFPYYVGEVLHLLGIGLVDSIKTLFILSVILSGIFMFLLAKELVGETAGLIASSLYIIAPFRLVDIYVRGSIGESLSFLIFPLLFWLTLRLILYPNMVYLVLTGIALAMLILVHNIMALVFLPFWLVFLFIGVKYYYENFPRYLIRYFLPSIFLGMSLSAFFWLPAIFEKRFIVLSQIPLADKAEHFIKPLEFLNSPWTYGLRPSFQLGWLHILSFIIGLIILLTAKGLERKKNFILGFYILFSTLALIFLTNSISSPVWRLPLLKEVDFPWRVVGPLTFFIALGGMFISSVKILRRAVLVLIFISLMLIPHFAKPETTFQKSDEYYSSNDATTTSMDELMPLWVTEKAKDKYINKVDVLEGKTAITNTIYNSKRIYFQTTGSESIIRINSLYFPGWEFTIDQEKIRPEFNNSKGVILLKIPTGDHTIMGNLHETPIRKWADIASIISVISIFILLSAYYFPRLRLKFIK